MLVCAAIAGCGQKTDIPRVVVSGAITYEGKPVEFGRIRFMPTSGTVGNLSIGVVKQGAYHIDDLGGVPAGTHLVKILSFDPDDPGLNGGPGGEPPTQLLPAKYNAESTLTETLKADESPKTLNFHLKE